MAFRIPHFGAERTILDDLAGVLKRRKLVIALTVLATVGATYGALLYLTEKYEADAKLLVSLGRENAEAPLTVERGGVYSTGVQKEEINSYIQLLESRDLIEAAVDAVGVDQFQFQPAPPNTWFQRVKHAVKSVARGAKAGVNAVLIRMGLRDDLSDRDKAVELVRRSLAVSREGESNVIRIALRLPSADLARTTVGTIVDLYLDRHVRLRQTARVLPIFDEQVADYRTQIERLQQERELVQREWELSDLPKQRGELLERLHNLERSVDARRTQTASLIRRGAVLEQRLAALDKVSRAQDVIEPNPAVQTMKERLVELRLERIDLASRYEESTPLVQRLDEEILALERLLAAESETQQGPVTFEPNPIALSFEDELERVGVQLASLEAEIEQDEQHAMSIQAELQRLNEGETRMRLINLDLQVLEQKFLANSTRREEARINEQLDQRRIANVSILSPPTAPPFAVYPKKMLVMGLSVIAGLLIGAGLGMLLEWGDDTIYTKTELARSTSLPYLGEFRVGGVAAIERS